MIYQFKTLPENTHIIERKKMKIHESLDTDIIADFHKQSPWISFIMHVYMDFIGKREFRSKLQVSGKNKIWNSHKLWRCCNQTMLY